MSQTWTYVGGATSQQDWLDVSEGGHGPWKTNVGDLLSPNGALVRFQESSTAATLDVTITPVAPTSLQPTSGSATYVNGSVYGNFPVGSVPYLMVASLAEVRANDAAGNPTGQPEWHLYCLLMRDDPENAGVMGAEGGGG